MLPKSIWNTNNALQVNFLPEEKILHFQKKLRALFGQMKIIKKKANQNSFHMVGVPDLISSTFDSTFF